MDLPIYCITLAEEPWRTKEAREHFEARGIQAIMVDGFYGATLGLGARLACDYATDGGRIYMHDNQIAHTLSYLTVLRMGIALNQSDFMVMEDDVELMPDFKERWESVKGMLREGYDVAQLEYMRHEDKPTYPINEHLAHCYYPFANACSWWTKGAAQMAARSMRPICEPTDISLMRRVYPFVRHVVVTPPMAVQRSGTGRATSTIGTEQRNVT